MRDDDKPPQPDPDKVECWECPERDGRLVCDRSARGRGCKADDAAA